jgi:hypothetical protein
MARGARRFFGFLAGVRPSCRNFAFGEKKPEIFCKKPETKL